MWKIPRHAGGAHSVPLDILARFQGVLNVKKVMGKTGKGGRVRKRKERKGKKRK